MRLSRGRCARLRRLPLDDDIARRRRLQRVEQLARKPLARLPVLESDDPSAVTPHDPVGRAAVAPAPRMALEDQIGDIARGHRIARRTFGGVAGQRDPMRSAHWIETAGATVAGAYPRG